MEPYAMVAVTLGVALVGLGALFVIARRLAVTGPAHEVLPFGSGWNLEQHAISRFHTRWYAVTLVFLAFDVEMLFMYPWAPVAAELGAEAIAEMFVFLGVLIAGVVWAWREGTFRWV